MTGCNHGKSDDELTRKDLFDVIEIYKKENIELKDKIKRQKETKKMYKRVAKRRRIYAGHLGEVLRKRNLEIKELKRGKIEVIIEKDVDGEYVVHCNKYKGCLAGGKTIVETKKMFEEAFICYLLSMFKHNEYFNYKLKEEK